MVGELGDRVDYVDNREVADANLSQAEQSQLTKMSLSKIVGNLRSKLKDEERRVQALNLKLDQMHKEKDSLRDKLTTIQREKKLSGSNFGATSPQPRTISGG